MFKVCQNSVLQVSKLSEKKLRHLTFPDSQSEFLAQESEAICDAFSTEP